MFSRNIGSNLPDYMVSVHKISLNLHSCETLMSLTYSPNRNNSTLMAIHNIPRILKISDIGIRKQSVLFVGVEQGKILHDDC
jgi:hypothetical protein